MWYLIIYRCFVGPPLVLITTSNLFSILSINFSYKTSTSISFYSASVLSHNSQSSFNFVSQILRWHLRCSQRCSMGLRLGNGASQSIILIPWWSNYSHTSFELCLESLSCWKITSSSEMSDPSMLESKFSSRITMNYLAHILPSTFAILPTPFPPMHPYTFIFLPWCLAISSIFLLSEDWSFCFHTQFLPSHPNFLIFISFHQITVFQSFTIHSLYFREKFKRWFLSQVDSSSFFFFTMAFI